MVIPITGTFVANTTEQMIAAMEAMQAIAKDLDSHNEIPKL